MKQQQPLDHSSSCEQLFMGLYHQSFPSHVLCIFTAINYSKRYEESNQITREQTSSFSLCYFALSQERKSENSD